MLEIYQLFEYHAILLPYSAAALFRCLRTLQLHTFPNRKSIGTSKKSGLNPCNFTSAKPTVQHSEHLFEFENHVILSSSKPAMCAYAVKKFEYHVISSSSKPLRGVWISLCPFEYHAISYTPKPNLCVARDTVVFEPYAISSASKTIRRG